MGLLGKSKKVKENEAEIARLRQELTNANTRFGTAAANSQSLKQRLDALQVQYTGRESRRVNELQARVKDLQQEKQALQASNASLNKDLDVFRTKGQQRTLEVGTRDVAIQELQQALARVDIQRFGTAANSEVADLLSIVHAQGAELQRLELSMQEKERILSSSANDSARKGRELAELQDQYTRVEKDFNRLRMEWQTCKEANDENQRKWTDTNRQHKTLLDSTRQAHRKELGEAWEQMRSVTSELESLQATVVEKEYLVLAKQREIEDGNNQNENLRQQIVDRDSQIARLQHSLDESNEILATARLNLNQTRNQLNIETRKARTVSQEKAERDKKIEFMQQQCVSMHLKLTAPKPTAPKNPKHWRRGGIASRGPYPKGPMIWENPVRSRAHARPQIPSSDSSEVSQDAWWEAAEGSS
ncbi:hypothetical protein P154DRAFT_567801 [Amniculicola lignicola CBS 123094]|uniref:Uncharacterized protein n=1 Tax=Amniculicola lignicola CBS 123094 TaxID=1392246 RepID=A0A6A5W7W9_9PLEO|nr:hypothetical protein P154DRAFT_567801 [Amniculicola lignicola CBS 123094]